MDAVELLYWLRKAQKIQKDMRCTIVINGRRYYVSGANITKFYDEDALELTCGKYAGDDAETDMMNYVIQMGWYADENT